MPKCYENGAVGRHWTSAVNAGGLSAQHIRIVGTKASLEWCESECDKLHYEVQGQANQILTRGMPYLSNLAKEDERLGALHYEGLIESWANCHTRFAMVMDAMDRGDQETLDQIIIYPDIQAGIDGVKWINACVKSADNNSRWVNFETGELA